MKFLLTLVFLLIATSSHAEDRPPQSTFDRVFSTGEISCASFVFNGLYELDANSGAPKGFFVEVMNEVTGRLQIKPRFSEIGGMATAYEELKRGQYDMLCASVASFAHNYSKMLFTTALFYDPIYIWGDSGRDYDEIKSLADINQPKWRIGGMDGELGGIFGPIVFPQATMHMVGQQGGFPTLMLDLMTNKADFVMLTRAAAQAYEAANPGKLRQIMPVPVASYPIRFVFKPDDLRLKEVFDMVLEDMRADGALQKLIARYNLQ